MMTIRAMTMLIGAAMVAVSGPSAFANTIDLSGQMGFLGEWEISGHLTQNDQGEFSGPLSMTHTGLCTHEGPEKKQAQIRLVASSRVKATISMDGAECAFSTRKSNASDGELSCPNSGPIPLTLRLQR